MHVHVLMIHGFSLRDHAVFLPDVKMKVLQSTDISGNTQQHNVTFRKTECSAT